MSKRQGSGGQTITTGGKGGKSKAARETAAAQAGETTAPDRTVVRGAGSGKAAAPADQIAPPGALVLIPAMGSQHPNPIAARLMFRGSYTQSAIGWAESHGLRFLILHPGVGAVGPDYKIAPDLVTRWDRMTLPERENWGRVVGERIRNEANDDPILSFCSAEWNDLLRQNGLQVRPWPPASMPAPQRVAWMMETYGDVGSPDVCPAV